MELELLSINLVIQFETMHSKDERWEDLYLFAKQLANRDPDFVHIEKQLSEKTTDHLLVADVLKHLKQVHYAIKRKNGLIKLGFGGLLLVIGFIITVINFRSNESFTFVMYGFTSAGLLLLFWGLYDIFG